MMEGRTELLNSGLSRVSIAVLTRDKNARK